MRLRPRDGERCRGAQRVGDGRDGGGVDAAGPLARMLQRAGGFGQTRQADIAGGPGQRMGFAPDRLNGAVGRAELNGGQMGGGVLDENGDHLGDPVRADLVGELAQEPRVQHSGGR